MNQSITKRLILTVLTLPVINAVLAQGAAKTAETTVVSDFNQLAVLLLIISILLAFVIWGMGQVLVVLGRQILDKNKKTPGAAAVIILLGLSLLGQAGFAQDANAGQVVKEIPNYGGLSETTFYLFVTVIGMELVAILFLAFSIRRMYTELLPEKVNAPATSSRFSAWWGRLDKRLFTKAIPVEQEADVLMDHNYDGIQELDNALPPWWKYGFIFTIGVAAIYLLNFHVFGFGKNPSEEYTAEMENARMAKEAFEAKNKDRIDENNVPMADAAGLAWASGIFTTPSLCMSCHGPQGQGNSGPNLTDDYWLHKGSLNDIYQSIKHGYPDKGMQAWNQVYTPKEISFLASYVKSLRGTNLPNPKAPQGDLYTEAPPVPGTDSAKSAETDTVKPAVKDTVMHKK